MDSPTPLLRHRVFYAVVGLGLLGFGVALHRTGGKMEPVPGLTAGMVGGLFLLRTTDRRPFPDIRLGWLGATMVYVVYAWVQRG